MTETKEWDMEGGKGFHDAVYIFPEMTATEFEEFKEDIREHGLKVPIVTTPDGLILDGRHRWNACMQLKIEPSYQVHAGNPWEYVISANLHRRHLTTSQRAMVAGRLADAVRGGQPGNTNAKRIREKKDSFQDRPGRSGVSQDKASQLLRVSHSAITDARKVQSKGVPELVSIVDEGSVPVATAARVAKTMNEEAQREFVERVKRGDKPRDILAGPPPLKDPRYKNKGIDKTVLNKKAAEGVSATMAGIQLALNEVVSIDPAITVKEAKYLADQIGKAKTVLTRVQTLLKKVE